MNTERVMPVWLAKRAFSTPERLAIITSTKQLTFAELHSWSTDIAHKLISFGIKKGDYIGVLSNNSVEMVAVFHALQFIGAILVPLNTRLTADELTWQLTDCHAKTLIYDPSYDGTVEVIHQKHPQLSLLCMSDIDHLNISKQHSLKEMIDLNEIQTIIYTSGTTGFPKGVQLSYGNHWWSAIGSALNLGLSHQDIWLASVPLFHVSGLSILIKSVIYGMPVHLHHKFNAQLINQAIQYEGVTMISVVSTMLQKLLDDLGDDSYPTSFRCMLLGGGPAPKVLLEKCRDKNIPIYQTYGMTETASQIVTLSPEYMLTKLGSAGKPLFYAQVRIVEQGRDLEAEQPGEIVVSGPNVTHGYLNNDEASNKVIKGNWLYTGDIGYLDREGFLYVLDRRKDLIISGGENVYPAEIEAALLNHPSVEDVGVIGIADEQWGQVPVAFVKIKSNVDWHADEFKAHCYLTLASYKVPKYYYEIDDIPRNASKKLLRRQLYDYLPTGLNKKETL